MKTSKRNMGSEYSYRFTHHAVMDLEDDITYLSEDLKNIKAATDFQNRFEQSICRIRTFPNSGIRVFNEYLKRKNVRKIRVKPYMIYYSVDDKNRLIIILRIIYEKRDIDDMIQKMEE